MKKSRMFLRILNIFMCIIFIISILPINEVRACAWFRQQDDTQDKDDDDSDCKKKEQSDDCPKCDQKQKGEAGEPVYLFNGKFYYKKEDLSIPSRIPINIIRFYDSMSSYNTAFGYGWTMSYNYRLYRYSDGKLLLQKGNNDELWYSPVTSTEYMPSTGFFDKITLNVDGSYTLTVKNNKYYDFAPGGYLTKIRDINGNELRFTYDTNGGATPVKLPIIGISPFANKTEPIIVAMDYRLLRIEEYVNNSPTGKFIDLFYNTDGRTNKIRDYSGREIFYVYDSNNNGDLISVLDAEGNPYNYTYVNHKMETFVGMGCSDCSVHTNIYDSQGRVISQEHGSMVADITYITPKARTKVETSIYNDGTGELLHIRNEYYDFNAQGYVTKYTRQMGNQLDTDIGATEIDDIVTMFTYTNQNQTETMTDPLGNMTTYTYDSNNNILTETTAYIGGKTITKTYVYDSNNNKLSNTTTSNFDANTYITTYTYDAHNNLLTETKTPDGVTNYIITYIYNTDGTINTITYPKGNRMKYEYNNAGFLTKEYDPDNLLHKTEYTYDQVGNRTSATDANNNVTTYAYDKLNRIISITNPLGEITLYTYTDSNLTQIEQGKTATQAGHITKFTYDEINRKTAIIKETASGDITIAQYTYDSEGNVLSITDANGNTTHNSYDEIGRLISASDPLDNITVYVYDKLNNLISITDAEGNITTYQYDGLNRLISVIQPEINGQNPTTLYAYNALGNILTITDAENHTTTNTYDKLGRLKSITDPLNHTTNYSYDSNDNLTQKIDANGAIINYEYNNYNQLTAIRYPLSAVSFTYDNIGNLLTVNSTLSTLNYTYDALNRISSVTTTYPFGNKTISYTYDRFGNKVATDFTDLGETSYAYDDLNRLVSIIASGSEAISYQYDSGSRLTTKTLGNGTIINYTYDNANRLLTINSTLSTINYSYDSVGNRLTKTDTYGMHEYGYDNLYRLSTATIPNESYSYDKVGNRLTNEEYTNWQYNAENQLTSYNSTTFSYDPNGNTTTKVDTSGTTTYSWDYENRITSINSTLSTLNYTYDAFGKRLSKTIDSTTTYYLYDNEDIVAEYDNAGNLLRSYIHGSGIDEPVRMTDASTSSNYFYLSDGLGSITQIQDFSKNTVESYIYDSFGIPTIKDPSGATIPQSTIHNPYLFTAREWDSETGLYYYRARYYDAGVGRFISEDPMGFEGGIDLYLYVEDNPINRIDPLGLTFLKIPKSLKDRLEYGNWGGSGRGSGEPIDAMDKCFRAHDYCYGRRIKEKCPKKGMAKEKNCDEWLVDCLNKLPSNPRFWNPPAPDPFRAEVCRRDSTNWFGKEKWKEDDGCKDKCK